MKKIIISVLVSIFIMIIIPFIIVEFSEPHENAISTRPDRTEIKKTEQ